jgi:hypothetical protein
MITGPFSTAEYLALIRSELSPIFGDGLIGQAAVVVG